MRILIPRPPKASQTHVLFDSRFYQNGFRNPTLLLVSEAGDRNQSTGIRCFLSLAVRPRKITQRPDKTGGQAHFAGVPEDYPPKARSVRARAHSPGRRSGSPVENFAPPSAQSAQAAA